MKLRPAWIVLAAGGAVCLAAGAVVEAQEGHGEPEVAGMFRDRCSTCHTVPDPAVRTDRAWLDQVRRTS